MAQNASAAALTGLLDRLAGWWQLQRPRHADETLAAVRGASSDGAVSPGTTLMAEAEEYLAARQAASPAPQRRRFDIDVHVSRLEFYARFLGLLRVRGSFGSWHAAIDFVDGEPFESSLEAEVRSASLTTGISLRDRHLRGARFLNAAAFPVITFHGRTVERHSSHFTLHGRLTLRGVTHEEEIQFVPVPPLPGTTTPPLSLRFRGSMAIQRSRYAIWSPPTIGTFFGLRPRIIGDTVLIEFEVLAVSEHFSATVSRARGGQHGGAAADR